MPERYGFCALQYHHIEFGGAAQELLPKSLDNSAISSIIKKDRSNGNRLRPGQWNPGKRTERGRAAETLSLRPPQPPEQPPARSGTQVRRYRTRSGAFTARSPRRGRGIECAIGVVPRMPIGLRPLFWGARAIFFELRFTGRQKRSRNYTAMKRGECILWNGPD